MKCSKCGNEINETDKFCGNCGNGISDKVSYPRLDIVGIDAKTKKLFFKHRYFWKYIFLVSLCVVLAFNIFTITEQNQTLMGFIFLAIFVINFIIVRNIKKKDDAEGDTVYIDSNNFEVYKEKRNKLLNIKNGYLYFYAVICGIGIYLVGRDFGKCMSTGDLCEMSDPIKIGPMTLEQVLLIVVLISVVLYPLITCNLKKKIKELEK